MDKSVSDGWKKHKEEQQKAWLRLSPAERLAWLEQAKAFCRLALGRAQRGSAATQ
jgi:hypothetical protein